MQCIPFFLYFPRNHKRRESPEAPFAVDYRNITLHYYYCRCDEDGESRLSKDPGDQSSNPQMLTHPSATGDSLSRYALILPNFRKQSLCVHIQL